MPTNQNPTTLGVVAVDKFTGGDASALTVQYKDTSGNAVSRRLADFLLSTDTALAGNTTSLSALKQAVAQAVQSAGQAADAVSGATATFLAKASLQFPQTTSVAGYVDGAQCLSTNSFSAKQNGMIGAGSLVGWNDPSTNANTVLVNINPGVGRGGFSFLEKNSGYDATTWKADDFHVSWGFQGNPVFGAKGRSIQSAVGRHDSGNWQILAFNCAPKSFRNGADGNDEFSIRAYDAAIVADGGDGTASNARLRLDCGSFEPMNDGAVSMGSSGARFSAVYAATGTIQTSDVQAKTVIGTIGDPAYADSAKLGQVFDAITPKTYTLKAAEDAKGADARTHIGVIAQDIQSAFAAAGLDAANFGLWGEDASYTEEQIVVPVEEKFTDAGGKEGVRIGTSIQSKRVPEVDAAGKPVMHQSVRYDEIAMLMLGIAKIRIADLEKRLAALEAAKAAGGQ
ncbi:hypothetical protein AD942_10925 [Gluconobacter japonicus]|uniref:tail fiber domain-containing protein n=1 Tax=Gluconobacter japonicus TaxID=376620 RepID=UPI00078575D1|nr:tail fiber domain-containing protein [Gluconobacter japonicus]KXV39264.1 hypothetical protein AD942_10925 [Gluconobacter japonicus]